MLPCIHRSLIIPKRVHELAYTHTLHSTHHWNQLLWVRWWHEKSFCARKKNIFTWEVVLRGYCKQKESKIFDMFCSLQGERTPTLLSCRKRLDARWRRLRNLTKSYLLQRLSLLKATHCSKDNIIEKFLNTAIWWVNEHCLLDFRYLLLPFFPPCSSTLKSRCEGFFTFLSQLYHTLFCSPILLPSNVFGNAVS